MCRRIVIGGIDMVKKSLLIRIKVNGNIFLRLVKKFYLVFDSKNKISNGKIFLIFLNCIFL